MQGFFCVVEIIKNQHCGFHGLYRTFRGEFILFALSEVKGVLIENKFIFVIN